MKARPTEYKGVRFKSKSEAILARNFDLLGFIWQYEPDLGIDWNPDFFIIKPRLDGLPHFEACIEYKPKWVTETYLDELASRYKRAKSKYEDILDTRYYLLLCMDFYAPPLENQFAIMAYQDDKMVDVHIPEKWGPALLGKTDEAKDFRFDLCAG